VKCVRNFGWEKMNEESCLYDVGVVWRVTFECMLKKLARGGVEGINLTGDWGKWRAVQNVWRYFGA